MTDFWNQPDWFAADCPDCLAVLRLPFVAQGICWCACGCIFEVGGREVQNIADYKIPGPIREWTVLTPEERANTDRLLESVFGEAL